MKGKVRARGDYQSRGRSQPGINRVSAALRGHRSRRSFCEHMPLTVVRSDSNAALWQACVSRFLDELDEPSLIAQHPSHLWLAHRTQRDLLLEAAEARGLKGWFAPPFSFLSELPRRFEIEGRPLGPLAGRLLLARIASRAARDHEFDEGSGPGRSHMIDRTLSELLPEGVSPDELEAALSRLPGGDFTGRRNRWLSDTYRRYLSEVETGDRFDPRSVSAKIANRIASGALRRAVSSAGRLHVYGVTSLRGRTRLFEALSAQRDVETRVYVPYEADPGEWERLADGVEDIASSGSRPRVDVQPAPDAVREATWVARSIKELLLAGEVEPHEVAVIARSGREDTRRIREALRRAGVPSTARIRSPLGEVPALRALLALFEAAAENWTWASLRPVLKSPYLDSNVDVRALDFLSTRSRPESLEDWIEGLERLLDEIQSDRGWVLARAGITEEALRRDIPSFKSFAKRATDLSVSRSEEAWVELTRRLLRGEPFGLRDHVCDAVEERWDVVRLDQRGVLAVESLLREWRELLTATRETMEPGEWYQRLSRALGSNEIALSTPLQRAVQVLEAHEAPLTPFKRTFLIHANDGVFPRSYAGGLFTERERGVLSGAGVPLSTRDVRIERERRLWRACAGSAHVTVTYWTADSNGVPRLPSLFVPVHERRNELPRTRRAVLGPNDAPVTRSELLETEVVRFIASRRREETDIFATPAPEALQRAALSAFADELRCGGLDPFVQSGLSIQAVDTGLQTLVAEAAALFANERPLSERPTPWNGELRDPAVLALLASRFPTDREWSASQLEQYGRRPFDFLIERVLGLSQTREAEDEANRLTIGGLVHEVLERFYSKISSEELQGSGPGSAAHRRFERIYEEVCNRYEAAQDRWVGLPHVWAATRDELRGQVRDFLDWELGQRDVGEPMAVELAFGRRSDLGPADLSGRGRDGVEHALLLGGRIDRVDRIGGPTDDRLRIVDYKSGGATSAPSPRAFDDGAALQNALYMAAVERLGLGTATAGVYRTVRAPANRARRKPADIEPALELARMIPHRVRSGAFEAVQAGSTALRDWQHGADVSRSIARVSAGTRFDLVVPSGLPGARSVSVSTPRPAPEEVS